MATDAPNDGGPCVSRSRRESTRAIRSGSRTRARRDHARAPRAACTWPSTSSRTRRSSATAPSSSTRPRSRSRAAPRDADHGPDGRGRRGGRDQARDPAGNRDPAARQGRPASPPGGRARRPPRPHQRRRPDEAVEAGPRAARRLRRGGRRISRVRERRPSREARARLSATGSRGAVSEVEPGSEIGPSAPGSSSRSRPTSKRSKPSARSWGGPLPGEPRSNPRSSWSTRDWAPGSIRPVRRRSERTCRLATGRRRNGRSPGVAEALGHLQAFGLRPIGELRTRLVHEADWAEAWKTYFPVLRVGRRLVIRPTWRRHRRGPDDVVLALDPGMAFGTGLHPTTRLCLAGVEALSDRGVLAGARVSTSAAARGSWRSPR